MTTPNVKLRFLRAEDLPTLHATYVAAFADYAIPGNATLAQIQSVLARRGAQYELSVGAFQGDEMVAVMATGFGDWSSAPAGYDMFTGVIPGHRGRGLATEMLDFVTPELTRRGAKRFLLEALQTNVAAIRAYEKAGFTRGRELVCFGFAPGALTPSVPPAGMTLRPLPDDDGDNLTRLWSWSPSWQNTMAATQRCTDPLIRLGAFEGDRCVGYGLLVPGSGDVPQLAVAAEHRRRGLGSMLLGELSQRVDGDHELKLINIDGRAEADLAFYRALGAREITRQWEFERPL